MPSPNRMCRKCGSAFYSRKYNPKCPNCCSTQVSMKRESARIRSLLSMRGW